MRFCKSLFLLCAGHALCDYPLQGDFLAKGKNHTAPLPGVPYQHPLSGHALIQAGMVLAVTDSVPLALAERPTMRSVMAESPITKIKPFTMDASCSGRYWRSPNPYQQAQCQLSAGAGIRESGFDKEFYGRQRLFW